MSSCKRCAPQVFRCFDVLVFLIVVIIAILFRVPGLNLPLFIQGFYCDDASISYPYIPSTVPIGVVYSVGIIMNCLLILIAEIITYNKRKQQGIQYLQADTVNRCCGFPVHPVLYEVAKYWILFAFGLFLTMVTFDVTKNIVGRLRPNFLDVCQVNLTLVDCNNGPFRAYVVDDVCTGPIEDVLASRRSFPSGHSALAVYFMLYASLYLESRWSWHGSYLLKPFTQLCLMYLAFYVCVSRMLDNKHHLGDVFCGAFIGAIYALIIVFWLSNLFHHRCGQDQHEHDCCGTDTMLVEMNTTSSKKSIQYHLYCNNIDF
ncbi:phospholipid phosphatase 2-like [Anneissia japonica]|uniref:phospholipid phosphatase 2-like n=1 Tax=Anneissia japonica TaxID=1529436 RepID=UPI001425B106|nr:phospholipid phosphatase 2-like [Anneissia japonica]